MNSPRTHRIMGDNQVHTVYFFSKAEEGIRDWSVTGVQTCALPIYQGAAYGQHLLRASNMGNQLSGGEQQMLAIGRALVTNPRLLILDEATEGLAPRIREEIWACLAQLRAAGQTILVIDKYVERLLGLADRHLILERGKVVWSGDSAALDGDRALWERYLGV